MTEPVALEPGSAIGVPPEDPVPCVVVDTNIVLDLWLFQDARYTALRVAIEAGQLRWLATEHMLGELAHVLRYPHLVAWAQRAGCDPGATLDAARRFARCVDAAPTSGVRCKDRDDQVFVDLAVAHRAMLISKDRAVLKLRRNLAKLGVTALAHWTP